MKTKIQLKFFGDDATVPQYATKGSAAVDLCAVNGFPVGADEYTLDAGQKAKFGAGLGVYIADDSLAALVLPRSGLGTKHGIILSNGTGLIDSDYQGEIGITLWNSSDKPFVVKRGERITQMVIVPVVQAEFDLVTEFSDVTCRGAGGFGSTGK